MKTAIAVRFGRLPKSYKALVGMLVPRPIHSEDQAEQVWNIISVMAGRDDLTDDQEDYLLIQTEMYEAWQKENDPLPAESSPLTERLAYLLEQSQTSQGSWARLLGVSDSYVSMVMRGKRGLTPEHIRKLSDHFGISAGYFV
ncbi:MAG: type II toxin-antitoxin system HigA family antitoxin [Tepidisphaerales bacterium]